MSRSVNQLRIGEGGSYHVPYRLGHWTGLVIPHSNFTLRFNDLAPSDFLLCPVKTFIDNHTKWCVFRSPASISLITYRDEGLELIILRLYRLQQHPPAARSKRRSGRRARVCDDSILEFGVCARIWDSRFVVKLRFASENTGCWHAEDSSFTININRRKISRNKRSK